MMFSQFRQAIMDFQPEVPRQVPDSFLLNQEGALSEYYIPFDYLNPQAQVVIVGITPGYQQWLNAVTAAQAAILRGDSDEQALYQAKQQGAFSGAIRHNLSQLLDAIGLADWLKIDSCAELFHQHLSRVHFTSLFTQPVFVQGKNYNNTPSFHQSALLAASIERGFAQEAQRLHDAVFVPLGPVPTQGIERLAERQLIDRRRVLSGLPHPSGANSERIHYFLGRKSRDSLSSRTNPQMLDQAREQLCQQMAALTAVTPPTG